MLGEKRGYWGKWMLGESGVQKQNMVVGGRVLRECRCSEERACWEEQGAGEREFQRRMEGVRRKWGRWGKGRAEGCWG